MIFYSIPAVRALAKRDSMSSEMFYPTVRTLAKRGPMSSEMFHPTCKTPSAMPLTKVDDTERKRQRRAASPSERGRRSERAPWSKAREAATASGLEIVKGFFEDRNMERSTCACCNELKAPSRTRTVSIEEGSSWLARIRTRLTWEHTTFSSCPPPSVGGIGSRQQKQRLRAPRRRSSPPLSGWL